MGVHLSDREQLVLRYRYGFEDGQMHSLEETAEHYHVAPERIQQAEAKALRKLGWESFQGREGLLQGIGQALGGAE